MVIQVVEQLSRAIKLVKEPAGDTKEFVQEFQRHNRVSGEQFLQPDESESVSIQNRCRRYAFWTLPWIRNRDSK